MANTGKLLLFSWLVSVPRTPSLRQCKQKVDACRAVRGSSVRGLRKAAYRNDELVLVVPRGHDLASRDAVVFTDIVDEELVGTNDGSAILRLLTDLATAEGTILRIGIQASSFEAILSLIEAGHGASVLPRAAICRSLDGRQLVAVPIRNVCLAERDRRSRYCPGEVPYGASAAREGAPAFPPKKGCLRNRRLSARQKCFRMIAISDDEPGGKNDESAVWRTRAGVGPADRWALCREDAGGVRRGSGQDRAARKRRPAPEMASATRRHVCVVGCAVA
ncbi:hypothetical protein BN2476_680096 [Paraburkholderia piptadeniae]|uniref:LysR substrate-binding domain-containing protein n=1 Tax=Paraburkholderia piptadeniae TaxID=1701573 RepID=A0A1N7SPV3_9BURK|nr:hypothetical protein BN2476_680096 [Paraburkholderia piptadeniae]